MTTRMKRQADSVLLLGILYLASTLATVQAVQHFGPPNPVLVGQPWRINCTNPIPKEFAWKRNGHDIPELKTGEISVEGLNNGRSAIYSQSAKEEHTGKYQCTKGNDSVFLVVETAIKYKVLANDSLPLHLVCENRTNEEVLWTFENQSITEAFKSRNPSPIKIDDQTGTLSILTTDNTNGTYVCNAIGSANTSTTFEIVQRPGALKLPPSVTVVEGEKLTVTCGIDSKTKSEGLKVKWLFANNTYTADDGRVKLLHHGELNGGTLSVENITKADAGPMACYVAYNRTELDNSYGVHNTTTLLRVKDKLAALWPFLGICAEVVVLCAIILIYEKKRNKSELEESDTDQSPDTKPTPNKDSEVRQRK